MKLLGSTHMIVLALLVACRASEPTTSSPDIGRQASAERVTTGVVRFTTDSRVEREGALVSGAVLRIEYPPDRSPSCRHTHNGHPAWDIQAHVMFLPSGEQRSGTVRAFDAPNGVPSNLAYGIPFETIIPANTERLEIWFENFNGADSQCHAYDSNYGNNYVFNVQRPVGWIGSPTYLLSRDSSEPCGTTSLDDGFLFDTWVRQRAALRRVCFSVWQAGVTDTDRDDIWQLIDAQVRFRFSPDEAWQTASAQHIGRRGNDALYAFDLSPIDPFRFGHCTVEPTRPSQNGQYVAADVELQLLANGTAIGSYFGVFEDYGVRPCSP